MRRRDLAAAAVLLSFGVVAASQARGLRVGTIAAPGPGFFPLGLAIVFTLVCVGLLVTAVRAPAGPAPARPGAGGRLEVAGTLAALAAYALLLESLGFRLATLGLLLVFFKALQRQRWLVALPAAAGTALLIHLVFRRWLGVNLPSGPWGL